MDANISKMEAMIGEISAVADTRWSWHILADRQAATADVMAAFAGYSAREGVRPDPFLLTYAGSYLQRAIQTMWSSLPSSDEKEPMTSTLQDLLQKLNDGDLSAYFEMSEIHADQGSRSTRAIGELRTEVARFKALVEGLRLRVDWVRGWQAGLNILGLVIVLLKDLPIWREA